MELHIRWMIRRDMPEVLAIERASFLSPWTKDDFTNVLRERSVIGMVAEHDDRILGHMVYRLHAARFELLSLAVSPQHRRLGIGSRLLGRVVGKMHPDRRSEVVAMVGEVNVPAQCWLRSLGFRCVAIDRGAFDEAPGDGYRFRLRVEAVVREGA